MGGGTGAAECGSRGAMIVADLATVPPQIIVPRDAALLGDDVARVC